jgi:hypothetical protein
VQLRVRATGFDQCLVRSDFLDQASIDDQDPRAVRPGGALGNAVVAVRERFTRLPRRAANGRAHP